MASCSTGRNDSRPVGRRPEISARRSDIKVLIFGIGNPGRRDDGLGPALLQEMREPRAAEGADSRAGAGDGPVLEFRYQLNVEDAYAVRDFDLVVFADAASAGKDAGGGAGEDDIAAKAPPEDVALTEIWPSATIAFTTHEMSPTSVLALCHELYGRAPRAFTLAIRGYEWDLGEDLSENGRANLIRAVEILRRFLDER